MIENRIITEGITLKVYKKTETDDNFLHRQTRSISINANILEQCDIVEIHLAHLGVVIQASGDNIKSFAITK